MSKFVHVNVYKSKNNFLAFSLETANDRKGPKRDEVILEKYEMLYKRDIVLLTELLVT
jgi:hypothetical protein